MIPFCQDPCANEEHLTEWIRANRMRFLFNRAHYTPDHVSWLAGCNGFDTRMVYRRFTDFEHALALTDPHKAQSKKVTWTVQQLKHKGVYDIVKDSWDDLGEHLMNGTDFE